MPLLKVGQSQIYYEVHGEGPDLIFVHGAGGNHASWYHQIVAFEGYRCITFDARGFGNSTDAEGLGRTAFPGDLKAIFEALEIRKAILVAQSMGGGTCLSFTCRHPETVRALVLADTLVGVRLPDSIAGFMADVQKRTRDLSQAERVLGATTLASNPAATMLYLQLASFNKVNVHTLTGEQKLHSPQDLQATGVPVLYVAGEEDSLFPANAIAAVQQEVANSTYALITKAGHSAYFERPDEFNRIVKDWLKQNGCGPTH
ncbi:alpha/beta hydrolase [Ferrovibrio sp.]|uniref:alpha/beta fold hydrolase n=1 Tax=Ferrovibrio sp. TaxID=1917215 RepID=UPI0025BC3E1C|nr:alpha/beta hydrolase [Ferrovibrio sp.]